MVLGASTERSNARRTVVAVEAVLWPNPRLFWLALIRVLRPGLSPVVIEVAALLAKWQAVHRVAISQSCAVKATL